MKHSDMKNLLCSLMVVCLITGCDNSNNSVNTELIPVKSGSKFGYVDPKGQFQINPQFDNASFFRDNIALVRSNDAWGYIDVEGKFLINPTYKDATLFLNGIAWSVRSGGAPTAINKEGEELFCLKTAEKAYCFSEGLARYVIASSSDEQHYLYGYVDEKGKTVIPPAYTDAGNFSDGLAFVVNEKGEYGYINKKGELVINYQFNSAEDFHKGTAIVCNDNGQTGTIDKKGKFIINPQFSKMQADGDNYLVILEGGSEIGWCDNKGKLIINPQFSGGFPFGNNDLAPISIGDKFGYIDKKGKIVINPQFDVAIPFLNNYAFVSVNQKIGTIDKEGKYVINPQFTGISEDILYDLTGEKRGAYTHQTYVITDYFNIDAITTAIQKLISKDNLDGEIGFNTPLSQILTKYNISENAINKHREFQQIKKINSLSDATINLAMSGYFFETVSDGWWGYNDVIKTNAIPTQYLINIELQNKGRGKEERVMMEIIKTLGGAGRNIEELDYGHFHLAFEKKTNSVIITITPV